MLLDVSHHLHSRPITHMLLVVVCVKVSDKTSFKNLVAHLLLTLEFVVTCLFMASCVSFFFHEIIRNGM